MDYKNTVASLRQTLRLDRSFDIQCRVFHTRDGAEASFFSVAGLVDAEMAEKVLNYVLSAEGRACIYELPCHDVAYSSSVKAMADAVLGGKGVLLVDGMKEAAITDIKNHPIRAVTEPENDRVLRGPRDGFAESLVRNTSLIRRRLRDPRLIMERLTVGDPAAMDVALCYVEGCADKKIVDKMRSRLQNLNLRALNMTQESLAEALIHRGWYNPFPKVRYTERPDAAAAMLEEGSVIIVCDNTPQVMILPTAIFDFLQETDDFYLPPLIGTYLRLTRMAIFLLSLVLIPLWYLLLKEHALLPSWLAFIEIKEPAAVPLLMQLLLAEFMIDGLKLASLNTPNMLNNSLSVVGGLILGDYAVEAGWFSSQTILYIAIVAIASFTQQSYELGYAFKFLRILLLLLVEFFGLWGFVGGLLVTVLAIAMNKTVTGSRSYLYPLIPFHGKALARMFFRVRLRPDASCGTARGGSSSSGNGECDESSGNASS